jgi:hypothetical protein
MIYSLDRINPTVARKSDMTGHCTPTIIWRLC